MEPLIQTLENIGLSKTEVEVYLALLELGPSTIVEASKKSSVKRTTIYEVVKSLIRKGLVNETTYGKRRRFIAEDPSHLLFRKERELEALRQLLPTLDSLKNVSGDKPVIQFFQGREGIKTVFRDILLVTNPADGENLEIETKPGSLLEKIDPVFFLKIIEQAKRHGLRSRTLTTTSRDALEKLEKKEAWIFDQPLNLRLLSDPTGKFNVSVYLYQNKIAIIAADQLLALVIQNQRLKDSFSFLFELLWAQGVPSAYSKNTDL